MIATALVIGFSCYELCGLWKEVLAEPKLRELLSWDFVAKEIEIYVREYGPYAWQGCLLLHLVDSFVLFSIDSLLSMC
jgi:hypothetical protein